MLRQDQAALSFAAIALKTDLERKKEELANCIAGEVVPDQPGVAVCIKGKVQEFPVTLQAVLTSWPFGIMYILQTSDASPMSSLPAENAAQITICPRVGRGLGSILSFLLLFEGKSMPIGDKQLEDQFNFSYDKREVARQLVEIEGIGDKIRELERHTKFSELIIRTDAGIYLAQPTAFEKLSAQHCQETCRMLADLGSVLRQTF